MARSTGEILAPAGGEEQLIAAVRCGANAVYLGGKHFNARRNAANFGADDLGQAVSYAHARGVKVYVTVNTVLLDSEMDALEEEAALVASSGADAVIIQDMAVLRLFRARYPSIKRYASTQTAVHNVDGARLLADAGFDSVVLARELTLSEMERICAAVPLKMEAFIHGAHCMSLSGACYLSSMLGGRSGNRGLCAQPCRLDWRCGDKSYALSLKDMSLITHIREMADAGVDSFKIEGRMKRPEYVAAAVTACKHALAGEAFDTETLRAVFSRSGFTDGYLTGKRDSSMFGYRTKEDVAGADGVLGELASLYRGETARVPVDMHFSLSAQSSGLSVSDGDKQAQVSGEAPQKALNRALDADMAQKSLMKTGGTPFFLRDFQADIEDGLMLPAAHLNAMRREALSTLLSMRGQILPHAEQPYAIEKPIAYSSPLERPALWARFQHAGQIVHADALEKLLLPLSAVTPALIARYRGKLVAQLPTLLFPDDEAALADALAALVSAGLSEVYTDNIYGLTLGRRFGCTVRGGFGLNITNTEALKEYEALGFTSLTVSFEAAMSGIRALGGTIPRGVVAYGYLPLMHFRNCPLRAAIGCAACGGAGKLRDRKQIDFPVACAQKKYAVLLNSVPLDIAARSLSGLDYQLLYFTQESDAETEAVIWRFLTGQKTEEPHTGGLYYRELL